MKIIGAFGGKKSGGIIRKILEENKDKLEEPIKKSNPWLKYVKDKSNLRIEK